MFSMTTISQYQFSLTSAVRDRLDMRNPASCDDRAIDQLIEQVCIQVPTLHRDQATYTELSTHIDISRTSAGRTSERKEQLVKGVRYTFHIPFDGSEEAFRIEPTTTGGSRPSSSSSKNQINVVIERRIESLDSTEIRSALDAELDKIEKYLGWLAADLVHLKPQVKAAVVQYVNERQRETEKIKSVSDGLGIPRKSQ